jgi:hypothetical protein
MRMLIFVLLHSHHSHLEHEEALDKTRQVMLLRVTKNLQALIKMGGHDNKQQAEMSVLDRKLGHLKHLLKDELRIRERKLLAVKAKINQHRIENGKLAAAGNMLTEIVGQRQQITDSKTQSEERTALLMEKSQLSAERRKMLDISEAQRYAYVCVCECLLSPTSSHKRLSHDNTTTYTHTHTPQTQHRRVV